MVWQFEGGAHYKLNRSSRVTGGIVFENASSSFEGSGTRATPSLSTVFSGTLFHVAYTYQY
jgi:hypothetical protein